MEYEIYLLCNLLGIILIAVILLFHFIEAEEELKEDYSIEDSKPKASIQESSQKIVN